MPQAERQRRWYANLTPEQREARRERDRESQRRRYDRDKKREWNARRIFAGSYYLGSFGFSEREVAEMVKAHAERRLAEFNAKQAEEREAWRLSGP